MHDLEFISSIFGESDGPHPDTLEIRIPSAQLPVTKCEPLLQPHATKRQSASHPKVHKVLYIHTYVPSK